MYVFRGLLDESVFKKEASERELNIIRTRAEELIRIREFTDLDRIVKSDLRRVNRTLNN